jgi:hypothetical protein
MFALPGDSQLVVACNNLIVAFRILCSHDGEVYLRGAGCMQSFSTLPAPLQRYLEVW